MMMDETRQAQLLDEYLSALQRNPQAPIPAGLDSDMAEFAQLMLGEPLSDVAIDDDRIWQTIQPHIQQKDPIRQTVERDYYMENLKEKKKNASNNRGWLPLVATAAISVLVSLALASVIFGNGGDNSELAASPIEVVTSAPIAIQPPVPTSTSFDPALQPSQIGINESPTFVPTAMQAIVPSPPVTISLDTPLECDFEGELRLEISQNIVGNDEDLQIMATVRNRDTEEFYIEIFGGFVTDDTFVTLSSSQSIPVRDTTLETDLSGSDYPAGSYLVRLRLVDRNGETLSSCSLPFYIAQ